MQKHPLKAVVANEEGEIFDLNGFAATGMSGSALVPLFVDDTRPMPYGSELMRLPERKPILYNLATAQMETLNENPYFPGQRIYPVAVFNSPGYLVSHLCAFRENSKALPLPLFSYGAAGWHRGKFRSAAVVVDRERRQDLRLMKAEDVIAGIKKIRPKMPRNRLRRHLEDCALHYGCPAAKNFFLGRYEAPLPTSPRCNARCRGCLSLQMSRAVPVSQERIAFTPSDDEIAEVALEHIRRVPEGIVSFGQGCEGDPLLAAEVIEPAIRKIRAATLRGTIHMNTNGSRPDILATLFEAGLDSLRISLNSVREICYAAYFRPKGYGFADVVKSIQLAIRRKKFVALNYLNCPGFTDTPEEAEALVRFLRQHRINLIQWRNLNIDPVRHLKEMNLAAVHSRPLGIPKLLGRIRKTFPDLKHGYYNPPREKFANPK